MDRETAGHCYGLRLWLSIVASLLWLVGIPISRSLIRTGDGVLIGRSPDDRYFDARCSFDHFFSPGE